MTFKLISFDLCPFVQRSVITLKEKNIPYEIEYIDLRNKPDWFLKISPFGKVPVLQVEDTVLFESAVINEYLDETTEGSMHPADPLKKAYNRAWIEFASDLGGVGFRLQMAKSEEDVKAGLAKTRESLAKIEEQLIGPLWNGSEFALVDAAFAPMLQRLQWSEDLEPGLGVFEGFPKVTAYKDALLARPSVKESLVPDIIERLHGYLRGGEAWIGRNLAA